MEFVAIEKVDLVNGENANNPLLTREAYWMAQLSTISPYGLNKRSELRSNRFRNHKSAMLTDKKVCEMAVHFNDNKHEFKDLEFVAIEKVDLVNGENANNPLLTREAYWMAQLCTISPYGLNKRSELRSKNRIHYKL